MYLTSVCAILILCASAQMVDKTVIEWSRQFRTCDTANDNDVQTIGTTRVVYSHNDQQTTLTVADANSPIYHGPTSRGSASINFFDAAGGPPTDANQANYTFMTRPVTLPAIPTYYHCQGFSHDWGTSKLHAIEVTPAIDYNNRQYVHHILLQVCTVTPLNATDLAWSGDCYGGSMPPHLQKCDQVSLFAGWAVGGGSILLPPQAGIPVQGVAYYLMQIHYNNPGSVAGVVDSVGMSVKVTPNLRPNDAACLEFARVIDSILIPPGNSSYTVESYANELVFTLANAYGGLQSTIYFFASFLHAHTLGRQIRVSQFRNTTYIRDIDFNPTYDFAYQQTVLFPAPIPFQMTDTLRLSCTYDSSAQTTDTKGGTSTYQEMCQVYLYYYPATSNPLTTIFSYPALFAPPYTVRTDPTFPTFVEGGFLQNTIGAYNGTRSVPLPTITPPACTTTHATTYTAGTSNGQVLPIASFNPNNYPKSMVLDADGVYKLYWNISMFNDGSENGIISFAAEVETNGWLGFGISKTGGMIGSDVVIGWVDSVGQTVTLLDRQATAQAQPGIDTTQDIFNVKGYKGKLPKTAAASNPIFYNQPTSSTGSSTGSTTGSSTTSATSATTSATSVTAASSSKVAYAVLLLVEAVIVLLGIA